MKAFRSKVANAAGRIKDGIERSVLAEDGPTSSGRSRRGSRDESHGDGETTYVRLPLEAAKRIRCFAKGDVSEIIARHLKEKEDLLTEILALRDLCLKCAPNTEVKLLVNQSKASKIVEVTKATNSAMVIAAKDEIERLRQIAANGGGGGDENASKKIAALEWKLEEMESEVTMLREEAADFENENSALQKEVADLTDQLKRSREVSPAPSDPAQTQTQTPPPQQASKAQMEKGSRSAEQALPVDFDFFSNARTPGGATGGGGGAKAAAEKAAKLNQALDLKSAECAAALQRLKQTETSLAAQQRKNKEIQKQFRALKEKHRVLAKEKSAEKSQPTPQVALQINVDSDSNANATAAADSEKSKLVMDRLEYEIQGLRGEKEEAQRELVSAQETLAGFEQRLQKQQKISKNQKSEISKMQLSLGQAQDKSRDLHRKLETTERDSSNIKRSLAEAEAEIAKLRGAQDASRDNLAAAAENLAREVSRNKRLEKEKASILREKAREAKALSRKVEAAQEENRGLLTSLEEHKTDSRAHSVLKKEGETLQNALDEMEAKLSDQQKEHNKEIQDLRDKTQDELQETVVLLRQMETRAMAAEEAARVAKIDSANIKKKGETSRQKMVDSFTNLILAEDRTTWAEPLRAAVGELEERAFGRARNECKDQIEDLTLKLEEAGTRLEAMEKVEVNKATLPDAESPPSQEEEGETEGEGDISKGETSISAVDDLRGKLEEREDEIQRNMAMIRELTEEVGALRAEAAKGDQLFLEISEWKAKHQRAAEELKSVRTKARMMMEAKDKELQATRAMSRLDANPKANPSKPSPPPAAEEVKTTTDAKGGETEAPTHSPSEEEPNPSSNPSSQTLAGTRLPDTPTHDPLVVRHLEGELGKANALILSLRDALEDSERTSELKDKSNQILKTEIHEMQRQEKRGNTSMEYVKNVLLKGFESGELDPQSSLMTVLSRLLEFSPEDLERIPKNKAKWHLHLPQALVNISGNVEGLLKSPLRGSGGSAGGT